MGWLADPFEKAVEALRSADAGERRQALQTLNRLGDGRALPLFVQALRDRMRNAT